MKRLVVLLTALAACGDDPAGRGDRTTDTSGDAPDAAEVRPDDDQASAVNRLFLLESR